MIYMYYSYIDNQQEGLFFVLLYLKSSTQIYIFTHVVINPLRQNSKIHANGYFST